MNHLGQLDATMAKLMRALEGRDASTTAEQRAQAAAEEARHEASRRREELRQLHQLRSERLEVSGVPLEPIEERMLITGEGFDETFPFVADMREWCELDVYEPRSRFIMLAGPVGQGKSLAASWPICRSGGAYVYERDLPQMFWDRDSRLNAGYLVVDDVGKNAGSERHTAAMSDLVEVRKTRRHKTCFITNKDGKAIKQVLNSMALWSRLQRSCTFVAHSGPDLRRQHP